MPTTATPPRRSPRAKPEPGFEGYSPEPIPMREYATLLGVFGMAFAGALIAAHRGKASLKTSLFDVALVGVATHKLGRIIARDEVTSPIRAPFVHKEKDSDVPSEVEEKPRGEGMQRAVGELVSCPWCIAPWVASTFSFGMVFAPGVTRFIAGTFCSVAVSDWLNAAYSRTMEK